MKRAKTKMHLVDLLEKDIEAFRRKTCAARLVVLWCGSTETYLTKQEIHTDLDRFEKGLKENDPGISPSMVYAYAAIRHGIPFINGAPNLTENIPALLSLAQKKRAPLCGDDFKTGQTMMKTVIAPALKARMLGLSGWFSNNILGNKDGKVLDDSEVHEQESMEAASLLMHRSCAELGVDPEGLILHADNGGPMKGSTMLATLQRLGIVPSFSRPRVSDDNPYSEALFRTLKYRPEYPRQPFTSIEEALDWVRGFVSWYNTEHLHSAINFVTPDDRHYGRETEILAKRKGVYEKAHRRHPQRWTGKIRNWEPAGEVWLNMHFAERKQPEGIYCKSTASGGKAGKAGK